MTVKCPHAKVIITLEIFVISANKIKRYGMGVVRIRSGDGLSVKLML